MKIRVVLYVPDSFQYPISIFTTKKSNLKLKKKSHQVARIRAPSQGFLAFDPLLISAQTPRRLTMQKMKKCQKSKVRGDFGHEDSIIGPLLKSVTNL